MNTMMERRLPRRVAAAALAAMLAAPAAVATDGDVDAAHTRAGRTGPDALTESFDRDVQRILRESQHALRQELDASLHADRVLALASRRRLSLRR